MPEMKKFLLNCFLETYDKNGQVDWSKIVNKHKAFLRLEIEIEKNGLGVEAKQTAEQIGADYSKFKKKKKKMTRNPGKH